MRSRVVLKMLILIPETCLINAGKAGRQPQMMPQVISATLNLLYSCVSAFGMLVTGKDLDVCLLVGTLSRTGKCGHVLESHVPDEDE